MPVFEIHSDGMIRATQGSIYNFLRELEKKVCPYLADKAKAVFNGRVFYIYKGDNVSAMSKSWSDCYLYYEE